VVANWFTVVFAVVAIANVFTGVIRKLNFFSDDPQHESGETDAGASEPAAAGGEVPAPVGEGGSADTRTVE
jgi:hypothetical protein